MTAIKPLQNNKRITSSCLNNHKITKSTSSTKRHCVTRMKLLTSGDIELYPGPAGKKFKQSNYTVSWSHYVVKLAIMSARIETCWCWWWRLLFFRAVSHQLYGDPNHHLLIRQAGVQYRSNNPKRFIDSWNEYINNMSMQGTSDGEMHCLYKQLQTVKMQQFILQNLVKILQGKLW